MQRDTEWSEHLDGFSTHLGFGKPDNSAPGNLLSILWDIVQVPTLLVLIGVASALVSYCTNYLVFSGNSIRWQLVTSVSDYGHWGLHCLWSVSFALLSCVITRYVCRESAGSGLPEMKTILSGTIKPVLLSARLVVAKVLGLACALIGGLSIGREGPLVHVSGALADLLMKLPLFRNIHRQDARRLEIIACACASGVAATFGTSYGSVLFSIELTASAYLVRTLPKAFLASLCATLVFYSLGVSDRLALFNQEIQSERVAPRWHELLIFLWIGIITGLLGVLFVLLVEFLSTQRNKWLDSTHNGSSMVVIAQRSYLMVFVVSLLTSLVLYYEGVTVPPTGQGVSTLFDYLFRRNDMRPYLGHLTVYFVYKFLATAVSVTLPLPVGLFTPIFLTGGVLGRVLGEHLAVWMPQGHYFPWEYSLLGAAGLATGVTRTLSTAVLVYELAGQPHLRLPLSIVVVVAYFVGNRFTKTVYDVLIDTNGTPYMTEVPKHLHAVPVAQVMTTLHAEHVLALDSTYKDAVELMDAISFAGQQQTMSSKDMNEDEVLDASSSVEMTSGNRNSGSDGKGLMIMQPRHRGHVTSSASSSFASAAAATASLYQSRDGSGMPYQQYHRSQRQQQNTHRTSHVWMRYAPTVLPIVKSRRSMVLVGAVLVSDLQRSLQEVRRLIQLASTPPVVLGRFEDVSFGEDSSMTLSEQPVNIGGHNHPSDDPSESMLLQTVQYVVVTNGGRSVVPVATNNQGNMSISPVSWNSMALAVPLDPSPYQIVDTMQLNKVDLLFRMLSLNQAYVTHSGKVVGVVTRSSLRDFLGDHVKRPLDRCTQIGRALWVAVEHIWERCWSFCCYLGAGEGVGGGGGRGRYDSISSTTEAASV